MRVFYTFDNIAEKVFVYGGGVAAAIVRKGGQVIQDESDIFDELTLGYFKLEFDKLN
jgi:O-acetyl-ADP-ribose deacetylase (regulator of RNase III)